MRKEIILWDLENISCNYYDEIIKKLGNDKQEKIAVVNKNYKITDELENFLKEKDILLIKTEKIADDTIMNVMSLTQKGRSHLILISSDSDFINYVNSNEDNYKEITLIIESANSKRILMKSNLINKKFNFILINEKFNESNNNYNNKNKNKNNEYKRQIATKKEKEHYLSILDKRENEILEKKELKEEEYKYFHTEEEVLNIYRKKYLYLCVYKYNVYLKRKKKKGKKSIEYFLKNLEDILYLKEIQNKNNYTKYYKYSIILDYIENNDILENKESHLLNLKEILNKNLNDLLKIKPINNELTFIDKFKINKLQKYLSFIKI